MRILHAITTLDPEAGGPPQVACRLASAQASLGHDVHLVHYAGEPAVRQRVDHADEPAVRQRVDDAIRQVRGFENVTWHCLRKPNMAERLLGNVARAFFREYLPRMDVLHLHGVWESIVRVGAAEALRQRRPYVLAPHGMLDPWSLSQRRWKKRLALAMGYWQTVNRASLLHCLNEDEARLLGPLRLKCPTRTIPNGIFLEDFSPLPIPGTFRRLHPELGEAPYVIFLARLHYKKGLDYLACAFEVLARRVPDLHLVVAGPDGGAGGDFVAAIGRAGLEGRTHVLGALYGLEKIAALVDASVFCLPSRQEGFSVAVLEAMACATPVVITENCHFPEVASSSAGYVVPLDASAVADALLQLVCDPVAAKQMGKAGHDMVHGRYAWPTIARSSIDAYAMARDPGTAAPRNL